MRTVLVRAAGGAADYPVHVGPGVLSRLDELLRESGPMAHRYALVSDETVAELHGRRIAERLSDAGLNVALFTFPPGERFKTRREWAKLTDGLLEWGMGRDGAVLAVGGGVTGDLAGFVAATYMRGVPVVQVPTSLVAMIDASVGGKTGVDVPAGKNLVGAFHPPRMVVADPEVVATLPRSERSQGLAEAVKHGAILDRAYLDELDQTSESLLDGRPEAVLRAVARSVELKAEVVSRDEREAGLRKILNFGHTLGHAVEAAAGYELPHGSAVSTGMVLEARLGERIGVTEEGTAERLEAVLDRFELPVRVPGGLDSDSILEFTRADKKTRGGTPRYVLLERLGTVAPGDAWGHAVEEGLVAEVLEAGRERGGER